MRDGTLTLPPAGGGWITAHDAAVAFSAQSIKGRPLCRQPRRAAARIQDRAGCSSIVYGVLIHCRNSRLQMVVHRDGFVLGDFGIFYLPSLGLALFFFFHGLADQRGVSGFRIDHGVRGQTTASHGVGIFLLQNDTVFNEFGAGGRELAPDGSRGRSDRLLLRRATGQKQTKQKSNFPHALCFRSVAPACRWQSWLQVPKQTRSGRVAATEHQNITAASNLLP